MRKRWRGPAGVATLCLVGACGGDAPASDAEPAAEPAAVEVSLEEVATEYAADLGVDLSAMRRLDNGVMVQDILPGEGEEAKAGDVLRMNYTGWLPDGTMFDSSLDGDPPIEFTLGAGQLIRGWEEGVPGMKQGGRRRLLIPPALAYGASGWGPIPPNATLVFVVDLVEIVR